MKHAQTIANVGGGAGASPRLFFVFSHRLEREMKHAETIAMLLLLMMILLPHPALDVLGQAADARSSAATPSGAAFRWVSRHRRRRRRCGRGRRGGEDGEPGRGLPAAGEERGVREARAGGLHGDGGALQVHRRRDVERADSAV